MSRSTLGFDHDLSTTLYNGGTAKTIGIMDFRILYKFNDIKKYLFFSHNTMNNFIYYIIAKQPLSNYFGLEIFKLQATNNNRHITS